MQKITFISSVDLISKTTVNMGFLAKQSVNLAQDEIDMLSSIKKPTKEEKALLKKAKKELLVSEKALKSIEKIFDLTEKSVVAFFKSDNKVKWIPQKFKNVINRKSVSTPITFEERLGQIVSYAIFLEQELEKHDCIRVFHDNGSSWNKTSVDKKRFSSIKNEIKMLKKIV